MLGLTDIKKGKVIVMEEEPMLVMSAQFSRKQANRPVVRSVLKNLKSGATIEHTFKQSDKVAEADMGRVEMQFLYAQDSNLVFMNMTSYEQEEIEADLVGEVANWLKEGEMADIVTFEDKPVSVELPIKVERKVIDAPPGVKGNTATNVMKDVTLEGGGKVKAPLFVNTGDVIKIDTRTGTYVERV